MHCIIGEHPPTHQAPHGTIWRDRDGLDWQQKGRTTLIGTVGNYRMMGGRDWQVYTPHGSRTGIMWSSDGFSQRTAHATAQAHAWTSPQSSTDDFHTLFPITRTFRLKALVLPITTYTSGTVDVKIGLYNKQLTRVYFSYALADSRLLFAASGLTPIGEPFMIPFNSTTQDGLILRKGCDLYVRAVWGSTISGSVLLRQPYEYSGTGTGNMFRTDRYTSTGIDYTQSIATLMSNTYAASFGTSAGTTSMAKIDWGMYGDFLD